MSYLRYSCFAIFVGCYLLCCQIQAQGAGRISGEMLSKERQPDGRFILNSGKFYYDPQVKQLIYQIRFPTTETVVSADTFVYRFQRKKLVQRLSSLTLPVSSIFHLVLTNQLKNFGLKAPLYTIDKVEKEGSRVFITYKPDKALTSFGQVKLAQRNNLLEGIVYFDKAGKVVARQFFKNYITLGTVQFPQEVSIESMRDGKAYYQLTTYKKIVLNDFRDEVNYRYALPK